MMPKWQEADAETKIQMPNKKKLAEMEIKVEASVPGAQTEGQGPEYSP